MVMYYYSKWYNIKPTLYIVIVMKTYIDMCWNRRDNCLTFLLCTTSTLTVSQSLLVTVSLWFTCTTSKIKVLLSSSGQKTQQLPCMDVDGIGNVILVSGANI